VVLVAEGVLDHLGDDRRSTAELGVAERVARASLGEELAVRPLAASETTTVT